MRVGDLAHLRRMAGTHSTVMRVTEGGVLNPIGGFPLQVGMPIHEVLAPDTVEAFTAVCNESVRTRTPRVFVLPNSPGRGEVAITPILDDQNDDVRFVVCWVRNERSGADSGAPAIGDLRPDEVGVHWRACDSSGERLEAAPVWLLADLPAVHLWPHAENIVLHGLAPLITGLLFHQVCEELARRPDCPTTVQVRLPHPGLLRDLISTVLGIVRSIDMDPSRLVLRPGVDVALNELHRPTLTHLRLVGVGVEIDGMRGLARSLTDLDDRFAGPPGSNMAPREQTKGPWTTSIEEALVASEAAR